jgi:hypothetical protein
VAAQSEELELAVTNVPTPAWIVASLEVDEGRDPLGLQTTTHPRTVSRDRRFQPDGKSLSVFIKRCEWEFGLAVQRCPRGCGFSPVGARRLGGVSPGPGPFPRGESVESAFGGYGLYG